MTSRQQAIAEKTPKTQKPAPVGSTAEKRPVSKQIPAREAQRSKSVGIRTRRGKQELATQKTAQKKSSSEYSQESHEAEKEEKAPSSSNSSGKQQAVANIEVATGKRSGRYTKQNNSQESNRSEGLDIKTKKVTNG